MSSDAPRTAHVHEARILEIARCSLLVLSGPDRGREKTIEADLFRIGKSRDNDLVLADETVSRTHCEIVREPKGYLLRDMGSTNGTLLDGAEIKEAWLKPGAVITIGKVELKVRPFSERIEMLPSEADRFGEVVGSGVRMREIFGLLERLGPTDATVLIGGETGTGKDVLARAIHGSSPRTRPDRSSSVELRRAGRTRFSKVGAVRLRAAERSRERAKSKPGRVRARRRAARCSSTRSGSCPSTCSRSCSGPSSSARSDGWAATRPSA